MFPSDELFSLDCIDSTGKYEENFYKLSATFYVANTAAVKLFENFSRVNFARQILMKLLIINFIIFLVIFIENSCNLRDIDGELCQH